MHQSLSCLLRITKHAKFSEKKSVVMHCIMIMTYVGICKMFGRRMFAVEIGVAHSRTFYLVELTYLFV